MDFYFCRFYIYFVGSEYLFYYRRMKVRVICFIIEGEIEVWGVMFGLCLGGGKVGIFSVGGFLRWFYKCLGYR